MKKYIQQPNQKQVAKEIHKKNSVSVIGFTAPSGTGKTTLLVKVIPLLKKHGLRVGVIKRTHHDFDIDKPGKDSYELRRAGANQMLVVSSFRWALIVETERSECGIKQLLSRLDQAQIDVVLIEGLKHEPFPKIELHRKETSESLMCIADKSIVAVATDTEILPGVQVPILDINDPEQISEFIVQYLMNI